MGSRNGGDTDPDDGERGQGTVSDGGGQLTEAGTHATFSQTLVHEIGPALGFADNADPNSIMSGTSAASVPSPFAPSI